MSATKRVGISKGTRFRIFTRDNFTCRYCGRQSDTVVLVVDHVVPVVEGGTNEDMNLATACEPCNQGKGRQTLTSTPIDNEATRLRLAQEMQEQRGAAEAARCMVEAKRELRQEVINLWCEIRGKEDMPRQTANIMFGFARKYGLELVATWVEIANERLGSKSDYQVGRYVCGIRRKLIEQGDITADGPLSRAALAPEPPPSLEEEEPEGDALAYFDDDPGSDMMVDPAFFHIEAFIE